MEGMKCFCKQARDTNIELLRILSILGVFILHYNNPFMGKALVYVEEYSLNHMVLLSLEILSVCAVDLFILITGYYMWSRNNRSFVKPFELILQVILFSLALYIGRCLYSGGFDIKRLLRCFIPNNYFVILYSALYLISPYINLVLQCITVEKLKRMLVLLLVLFSVWPTFFDLIQGVLGKELLGISTIGMYGSQYGYTIVNFALMYIIGASIAIMHPKNVSKIRLLCLMIINSTVLILWTFLDYDSGLSYCNPLVILQAVIVFLIFKDLKMNNSNVINTLAKSVFTMFIVHGLFLGKIYIKEVVTGNPTVIYLLGHLVASFCLVFAISFIAYYIYNRVIGLIMSPIYRYIERHDFTV